MISIKKYLLLFTAGFLNWAFCAAQGNGGNAIKILNAVDFYDGYAKPIDKPAPEGLIRLSNTKYLRKLTEQEKRAVGNKLTVKVSVKAGCDNYDRIGSVALYKTPKGKSFDDKGAEQYELLRIMTPFMYRTRQPDHIPYIAEIDQLASLFKDNNSDIWIMTEVFGTTGAGQKEVIGCNGSLLTFTVSVDLITEKGNSQESNNQYSLFCNYTMNGEDTVAGYNAKAGSFTLKKDVESAKLYVISSGHGAGEGGEEYNWREHVVYLDGKEHTRLEMSQNCAPYEIYNTQPNGIYFGNIAKERRSWCPGAPVPTRIINLGPLKAGEHTIKATIPEARLLETKSYYVVSAYVVAQ